MTTTNIIERFAPYPTDEESATAEVLYRHLLIGAMVQYQREVRPFTYPDGPRDPAGHIGAVESFLAQWSTLYLLRSVMGKPQGLDLIPGENPVDHAARNLWCVYEDGGTAAELLWDWLVEAGFTPEEIVVAYEEATAA